MGFFSCLVLLTEREVSDVIAKARRVAAQITNVERDGLNATIGFDENQLLGNAEAADSVAGPLRGMAVAIKDNIATLEYRTTCGSKILQSYQSPYEATVVERVKGAGGFVACKTNMDEFGMGSSTEHSAFGPCRNPVDKGRVPGGSSGGSAALVAVGAVDAALGSETGGSVRQPAAFCGVVGFKPTYGRLSRFGLVAFGSSLDQVGVLGRSTTTVRSLASVISGPDVRDSTCKKLPPIAEATERKDLAGLTIGLPKEYLSDDIDTAVRRAWDQATATLKDLGAQIRDVSLPHTGFAVATYYVIAPAEASANLARFDGVRYGTRGDTSGDGLEDMYNATRAHGFGPEVRRRIMVGTYVLSSGYYDTYYKKAQIARGLIAHDFENVFSSGVDLLFTPTTPSVAFELGARLQNPVHMYREDRCVCAANLAGVPAVSVPIGRHHGLPIGGQLIGAVDADDLILDAASILEQSVDGHAEI